MAENLKNLKIKEELHKHLKVYCAENDIKIGHLVEEVLEKELDRRKSCGKK